MQKFKWLIFGLLGFGALQAQVETGTIVGQLVDETGESLVAGTVRLGDRGALPDFEGRFELRDVQPGMQTLRFESIGFEPLELSVQVKPQAISDLGEVMLVMGEVPVIGPPVEPLLGSVILPPAAVAAVTAAERAPFTYTNVTAEELQKRDAAVDLPFLLRLTPSLVVTSDAGAGVGYTSMRIRGSDQTRINVTINGIPLNDAESHQVYWVDLPDLGSSIDGLQIQRGAGTSTNGPGAFGATVAANTLGFSDEPSVRAVLGGGSFNTVRSSIAWNSGNIDGSGWHLEGRLSRILSDGYIDRATSDLSSAHLGVARMWDSGRISYTAMLGHERTYQAWYGVPQIALNGTPEEITAWAANSYEYGYGADSVRIADLVSNGRQHNYYSYENQVDDYRQDHHQMHLEQRAGAWNLGLTGHWTLGRGYYEQFRPDDGLELYGISVDSVPEGDVVRRRWLDNDFYGLAWSADRHWDAGELTIGGGAFEYVGDHFGEAVWAEFAGDVAPGHQYYSGEGRKQDANVFARAAKRLSGDALQLQAEGQIRSVSYLVSGTDNDLRNLSVDDRHLFFNPKLGLDFQPSESRRVYASVAVAHREPSRTDYVDSPANADVRPERLTDFELGFTFRPTGPLQLGITGYHMAYQDQLVLTGALNDVGSPLRVNVDESWRQGLELVADWRVADHLRWSPNLTLSRNRIANFTEVMYDYGLAITEVNIDHGETDIAFSPNVVATSVLASDWTKDRPAGGAWLGTVEWALRHVGDQFLDNTSNLDRMLPAYTVSDLRFRSAFYRRDGAEWALNLFVNNVFDAMYSANGWTYSYRYGGPETEVTENFVYPQAGRHFMVSLELKL